MTTSPRPISVRSPLERGLGISVGWTELVAIAGTSAAAAVQHVADLGAAMKDADRTLFEMLRSEAEATEGIGPSDKSASSGSGGLCIQDDHGDHRSHRR